MFSNHFDKYVESLNTKGDDDDDDEYTKCTENEDLDEGASNKKVVPHFQAFQTHFPSTSAIPSYTQVSPYKKSQSSLRTYHGGTTTRQNKNKCEVIKKGLPPRMIREFSPRIPHNSK